MNPLSFVVLPAPRHGAFLKFAFASRGVRKRLSCDFSATFAAKDCSTLFRPLPQMRIDFRFRICYNKYVLYIPQCRPLTHRKHCQYIRNIKIIPPPKPRKGGENGKIVKIFLKNASGTHPSLTRLTGIQYEIQYQKNNFIFHRRCNDCRNTLFLFSMQRKQYFA